jgi:hypothetical protein
MRKLNQIAILALGLALARHVFADTDRLLASAVRYDQEYPLIDYSGPATLNRVWRLNESLQRGEKKLQWEPQQGYLRSLLKELQIDKSSQVLVFSKTSLQTAYISDVTPRAIYFNDDSYVAYVQHSSLIEFVIVDAKMGPIFFGLDNRLEATPKFEREGGRCLTCHDTYSMMGGGVPRVLAMSSPVDIAADTRTYTSASDVDDRTPLAQRWGGWYVTGSHGKQSHFGNLPLRDDRGGELLRKFSPADRASLVGYFDTTKYITDKSDIVALLMLEHQAFIHNLITRVNYKVRSVMAREGRTGATAPHSWGEVGQKDQALIKVMIEPLVRALFFADAAPFQDRIVSSSGFDKWFAQQGPRDKSGRSLREFDLNRRLFRWPLSYLIYAEHFNALPDYALDYVAERLGEILAGQDRTGISARLTSDERATISAIVRETKPALAAKWLSASTNAVR